MSRRLLDGVKQRRVLQRKRQQVTTVVVRDEHVLVADAEAVGGADAVHVDEQGVGSQAKEFLLVGANGHDLPLDEMGARGHARLPADLREAPRRLGLRKAPHDMRPAHERAAALHLNEVAVRAEVLDGSAHGDAAHAVLLAELGLRGDLLVDLVGAVLDGTLDVIVNLLVERRALAGGHVTLPGGRTRHVVWDIIPASRDVM